MRIIELLIWTALIALCVLALYVAENINQDTLVHDIVYRGF